MARRPAGEGGVGRYTTRSGSVLWRAHWIEPLDLNDPSAGTRQASKAGFATKAAAAEFVRQRVADLAAGRAVKTTSMTFGEMAETWVDGNRGAPRTVANYKRMLRLHILPTLRTVPLKAIRPTTLAGLYRRLEDGTAAVDKDDRPTRKPLGPNTVRLCHSIISLVLQVAVDDDLLVRNPARHPRANPPTAREVRAAKPEIHPWAADELERFLEWVVDEEDDPLRYAWVLAAHTGMRRGELMALRWGDIDIAGAVVSVRRSFGQVYEKGRPTTDLESVTKGTGSQAGTRPVDIGEAAVEAMRAQRRLASVVNIGQVARDRVVFTRPDGQRWTDKTMSYRFIRAVRLYNQQASEGAKVHPITLHDLRHTHATLLLQAGVHPKVVQERLGHANISITMDLYSHVMPTVQKAAVSAFEAVLAQTAHDGPGRAASARPRSPFES